MKLPGVFRIGITATILLASCTTEPVTGRKQFSLVGAGQETQLGITEFAKLKQSTPISKDPRINEMVQRVGKKIAAAAKNDLPDAQWEFVVFDSKEANAFCLPGGKVGIYTGILPVTQDEGGLATVMGHEVAHAAAHHGAERMSQATALQAAGQLVGVGAAAAGASEATQSLVSIAYPTVAQVGVLLPYSRKQESSADRIGLTYMARAGYDPAEALEFWKRFAAYNQQRGGGTTLSFLSTHPLDEVRIKQIQEWIPEVRNEMRTAVISKPAR
jgi:metalloendopeptidase OMA1, mitochondrial